MLLYYARILVKFAYLNDKISISVDKLVQGMMGPAVQIITEMLNRGYVNVRIVTLSEILSKYELHL